MGELLSAVPGAAKGAEGRLPTPAASTATCVPHTPSSASRRLCGACPQVPSCAECGGQSLHMSHFP